MTTHWELAAAVVRQSPSQHNFSRSLGLKVYLDLGMCFKGELLACWEYRQSV